MTLSECHNLLRESNLTTIFSAAISDWDELNDMVKSIVQEMKGDFISKFLESV